MIELPAEGGHDEKLFEQSFEEQLNIKINGETILELTDQEKYTEPDYNGHYLL